MRHWKIWLYLVGMIAILAGCLFASLPGAVGVPSVPTQVKVASQIDQSTETAVPVAEVAVEPTAEETEAPAEATEAVAVAQVDTCLACHTDKDQLIRTASAEEEVPEESEGAG